MRTELLIISRYMMRPVVCSWEIARVIIAEHYPDEVKS